MIIRRQSHLTGKTHEMDIPCTEEQLQRYENGAHIQIAMPDVPAPLREFVATGITPDEWTDAIGDSLGWNKPYLNKAREL